MTKVPDRMADVAQDGWDTVASYRISLITCVPVIVLALSDARNAATLAVSGVWGETCSIVALARNCSACSWLTFMPPGLAPGTSRGPCCVRGRDAAVGVRHR